MERWLGIDWRAPLLPLFGSTNPKVCLVLSGGGARATFQIGALSYLYAHDENFQPNIFVGASAGSILVAGLAQHALVEGQRRFLDQVRDIWFAMRSSQDMFTERPWFAKLRSQAPSFMDLLATSGQRGKSLLPFLKPETPEDSALPDPLTDPLQAALAPDREYQAAWSLDVVTQLLAHLGKLPRLGTELATIRAGFEATRSMYRPGPMLMQLLDPTVFDPARVRASGMPLRIAMVALESGELRYMREDGRLLNRAGEVFDDVEHDLTTGVLASCSIPGVFRAVPMGDETYVDGGVRENLPAEMALEGLDADKTYVISSAGLGVRRRPSMAEADVISVVMRSTEILIDEAIRDEMRYAQQMGAKVIRPLLDIHDAMTVRPGLIRINHDYGWSRAAMVCRQTPAEAESAVEKVYALRLRAYHWETRLLEKPSDVSIKLRLASAKRDFKEALGTVDVTLLPPGAEDWWAHFEEHSRTMPHQPFWL